MAGLRRGSCHGQHHRNRHGGCQGAEPLGGKGRIASSRARYKRLHPIDEQTAHTSSRTGIACSDNGSSDRRVVTNNDPLSQINISARQLMNTFSNGKYGRAQKRQEQERRGRKMEM